MRGSAESECQGNHESANLAADTLVGWFDLGGEGEVASRLFKVLELKVRAAPPEERLDALAIDREGLRAQLGCFGPALLLQPCLRRVAKAGNRQVLGHLSAVVALDSRCGRRTGSV